MEPKRTTSVIRAVDILKAVANGKDRIRDISNQLQLNKSTVHRFLKTLTTIDLVKQDPITRRYCLGPLVITLASKPLVAHQILGLYAFEEMKRLRDLTNETVNIQIRMGTERICVEELQSYQSVKYVSGKGTVQPVYCGSAGKILIAALNDEEIRVLLNNLTLVPVGPNTITDEQLLLTEIEKVRRAGYATSFGERIAGAGSISVPIRNHVCPVALSVVGPDNRMTLEGMKNFLGEMQKSARRISGKLITVNKNRIIENDRQTLN